MKIFSVTVYHRGPGDKWIEKRHVKAPLDEIIAWGEIVGDSYYDAPVEHGRYANPLTGALVDGWHWWMDFHSVDAPYEADADALGVDDLYIGKIVRWIHRERCPRTPEMVEKFLRDVCEIDESRRLEFSEIV